MAVERKTTSLEMILNVIHPSSGLFSWFANSDKDLNRHKIETILETAILYPYLSGQKNLDIFFCRIKNSAFQLLSLANLPKD